MSMLKKWKNMSNREFLFGDFDKDGVRNIDDPFPFNPSRKKWGKPTYREARYGDDETRLSKELRTIKRYNDSHVKPLTKFLKEHPNSKGRIKSVPSTIKKLRSRYIDRIRDI